MPSMARSRCPRSPSRCLCPDELQQLRLLAQCSVVQRVLFDLLETRIDLDPVGDREAKGADSITILL